MPAVFDGLGVRVDYPENWAIDADNDTDGLGSVTITSQETGFWTLSVYPADTPPAELLANAVETLRSEYPQLEVEAADEQIEGFDLTGFEVSFFYLDLISTAYLRAFQQNGATYLLLAQAEDRELARVGPVFDAMTVSFLRDLNKRAG